MAMSNSKTVKRLLRESTKALGRELTLKELYRLLHGDNAVLSKKTTNEKVSTK